MLSQVQLCLMNKVLFFFYIDSYTFSVHNWFIEQEGQPSETDKNVKRRAAAAKRDVHLCTLPCSAILCSAMWVSVLQSSLVQLRVEQCRVVHCNIE